MPGRASRIGHSQQFRHMVVETVLLGWIVVFSVQLLPQPGGSTVMGFVGWLLFLTIVVMVSTPLGPPPAVAAAALVAASTCRSVICEFVPRARPCSSLCRRW